MKKFLAALLTFAALIAALITPNFAIGAEGAQDEAVLVIYLDAGPKLDVVLMRLMSKAACNEAMAQPPGERKGWGVFCLTLGEARARAKSEPAAFDLNVGEGPQSGSRQGGNA